MYQQANEVCCAINTQDNELADQAALTVVKKPRKRARSAELYERVTEVAKRLGAGVPDWKVKKEIESKWGVRSRQAMHYLMLARKRLVQAIGKPVEELRAEAYARYMQIFDDDQAKPSDRVRANKGIVELLGLAVAKCVQIQTDQNKEEARLAEQKEIEALVDQLDLDTIEKLAEADYRIQRLRQESSANGRNVLAVSHV